MKPEDQGGGGGGGGGSSNEDGWPKYNAKQISKKQKRTREEKTKKSCVVIDV